MTLLLTTLVALAVAQQTPALRIVVIEGEGAVNIIQQKTAVSPLIEVRDRNDQPVAGAVVNFVVRNGRATFGGARTLTVTTNAAGRAAAAGFAPSGSGALQIGATATFQGQSAAAITIAQTNVMTAAEAAAASASASTAGGSGSGGAAGGGAGAGSGGGVSATTIGIVGGAVAAGAVVAKETLLDSGTLFTGQFTGVMLETDTAAPGFGNFSCTRNHRLTGTLTITLDKTEGAISGTMEVDGDVALSPGTCQPDRYNTGTDTFELDHGTVTGSPDNINGTGHQQNDYTSPEGSGVNMYDYTFTGRMEGEQISGSLTVTHSTTFRSVGGIYESNSRGTVSNQVVLRK